MELVTANQLWNDYEPYALPFNKVELSEDKFDGYSVKHIYFNGEASNLVVARVYARHYVPTLGNDMAVVLMNSVDNEFDETFVFYLLNMGFSVLVPDYTGQKENGKYTIYPESQNYANYRSAKCNFHNLNFTDPKKTCWYSYACVMIRSYCYLEKECGYKKVGLFGVKEGAFQVYKAGLKLENALFGIALFNSAKVDGIDDNDESEIATIYNACLATQTYATQLKVPTYIIESSNNREDSLITMSETFGASSESVCMYIAEHSDNTLSSSQMHSLTSFIQDCVNGIPIKTATPTINPIKSGKELYFEVKIPQDNDVKKVDAYYCYGQKNGKYRNWIKLKLERVSEFEFIAKANTYLLKEEVYAFVNITYANGYCTSSEVIYKIPYLLGVSKRETAKTRLIYQADMGNEVWLVSKSNEVNAEIRVVEDKNGIKGVTGSTNSITTMKIGDEFTAGESDSLLQIFLFSEENQEIEIEVVCREDEHYSTYNCYKKIEVCNEWIKVTVSPEEIKSGNGTMEGWDNAVSITFNSKKTVLINSLLWI